MNAEVSLMQAVVKNLLTLPPDHPGYKAAHVQFKKFAANVVEPTPMVVTHVALVDDPPDPNCVVSPLERDLRWAENVIAELNDE